MIRTAVSAYSISNKTWKVFSGVQGGGLLSFMLDHFIAGDGSGFLAGRGGPGRWRCMVRLGQGPGRSGRPGERGAPNDSPKAIVKASEPARQPENAKGNQDEPLGNVVFVDWEGQVHDLEMPADKLGAV